MRPQGASNIELSDTEAVRVFCPADPESSLIAPGSGIVGVFTEAGVLTYFEGNLYGAGNLKSFVERVSTAWGRLVSAYPTVAVAVLPPEALVEVGFYDPVRGVVDVDPAAVSTLADWLGVSPESLTPDSTELVSSAPRHDLARMGFGPEVTSYTQAVREATRRPWTAASRRLLDRADSDS